MLVTRETFCTKIHHATSEFRKLSWFKHSIRVLHLWEIWWWNSGAELDTFTTWEYKWNGSEKPLVCELRRVIIAAVYDTFTMCSFVVTAVVEKSSFHRAACLTYIKKQQLNKVQSILSHSSHPLKSEVPVLPSGSLFRHSRSRKHC